MLAELEVVVGSDLRSKGWAGTGLEDLVSIREGHAAAEAKSIEASTYTKKQ